MNWRLRMLVCAPALLLSLPGSGLAPADYIIDWWTLDGGGPGAPGWCSGGEYVLSGTIGQPDAGELVMSGGGFELAGGFWPGALGGTLVGPGDLNCDHALNADDIPPFVLALIDPAGYAAAYPDCLIDLADVNGDSLVNGEDVQAFVSRLLGV